MAVPVAAAVALLLLLLPVWAGGGPGPPEIVGAVGAPLWVACTAPDPRSAARVHRTRNNLLAGPGLYPPLLDDARPPKRNSDDYLDRLGARRRANKKLQKKILDADAPRRSHKNPSASSSSSEEDDPQPRSELVYSWYHNGTLVDADDSRRLVLANGTLFFKRFGAKKSSRPGFQDAGAYRCVASSSSHGATLSTQVLLKYAAMDKNFTRFPVDAEVNAGDAFHLPCSVHSVPTLGVAWEKNSVPIVRDDRHILFSSGSLLVIDAQKEDSGSYRCSVTNPVLDKTATSPAGIVTVVPPTSAISALEFVNPVPPEDLLESADNSTYQEATGYHGRDTVLSCAVKGRPKPKVTWSFLPDPDSERERRKEFYSMEILRLPRLWENSSGVYSCEASNGIDTVRQAYRLSVLRAPYFKITPASENSPTAKTVRFNCSADGFPPPEVVWYKDGQRFGTVPRHKIKKPSGIIIGNTVTSDKGVYQCIASNVAGEAEAWGALTFRSQKSSLAPPTGVRCKSLDYRQVRIVWDKVDNLIALTLHFGLIASGSEQGLLVLTNNSFWDLAELKPYERYEFYLRMYSNTLGASDFSDKVVCQGQGVPIFVYSLTNGSVLVSWREACKSFPDVKQWRLQVRRVRPIEETQSKNYTMDNEDGCTRSLTGLGSVDEYAFRMLASTATGDWPDDDLGEIPWTEGSKAVPYDDAVFQRELLVDDPRSENWTKMNYAPSDVDLEATGPHTVNVTWRRDPDDTRAGAEDTGNHFAVCYSRFYDTDDDHMNTKGDVCVKSYKTWLEVGGLESNTKYEFRVQYVIQNKGGPFSDYANCYTKPDDNAVVDVRWEFVDDGVLNVTWVPNAKRRLDSGNGFADNVYAVLYTHNPSEIVGDWNVENVANATHVQLRNVNMSQPFFFIVSLVGDKKGVVVTVPAGGRAPFQQRQSDGNDILYIGIGAALVGAFFFALVLGCLFCRRRRCKRGMSDVQSPQAEGSGAAEFECEEFVASMARVDAKAGVYMNGVAKETSADEPLLNGHVNITENPRFSTPASKFRAGEGGGALDLSRSSESDEPVAAELRNGRNGLDRNCNPKKRVESEGRRAAPLLGPNG